MPTTIALSDSMTDAEFMVLKARCEKEGTSVSQVRKDAFADEVFCDIWPAEDLKLEKIRDGIAAQQSRLDQLEAAARNKAEAFLGAIARRDALVATVRLLNERKARITDNLETQPIFIETIGADKSRSDADFVESVAFTGRYKTALVQLDALLEQNQSRLVLAESEVAAFQK